MGYRYNHHYMAHYPLNKGWSLHFLSLTCWDKVMWEIVPAGTKGMM